MEEKEKINNLQCALQSLKTEELQTLLETVMLKLKNDYGCLYCYQSFDKHCTHSCYIGILKHFACITSDKMESKIEIDYL